MKEETTMNDRHFSDFHIAGFTYYDGIDVFNDLKSARRFFSKKSLKILTTPKQSRFTIKKPNSAMSPKPKTKC